MRRVFSHDAVDGEPPGDPVDRADGATREPIDPAPRKRYRAAGIQPIVSPMAETCAATVMIIDDEPSVRDFFALALESAGFAAVRAASSEVALHLLDGGLRPDAVLLDINMPGMGGLGFLLRLRATPRYARLPVAIITAQPKLPQAVQSVADFMRVPVHQKPLDMDAVLRLTNRLVHGRMADPDVAAHD